MSKLTAIALLFTAVLLFACSEKGETRSPEQGNPEKPMHSMGAAEPDGSASGMSEHDGDGESAELPDGANRVCPVTGEEADAEVSVEYEGRTVYFCCDDCVATFEKDPAKYFAKAYPDAGK